MKKKKSRKIDARLVRSRRRRQVVSYKKNNGKDAYAKAGSKGGGKNSPGSFTSESASIAAKIGWEKRRQLKESEA